MESGIPMGWQYRCRHTDAGGNEHDNIVIMGESRAQSDSPYDEAVHTMQEADVPNSCHAHVESALGNELHRTTPPEIGVNASDSVQGYSSSCRLKTLPQPQQSKTAMSRGQGQVSRHAYRACLRFGFLIDGGLYFDTALRNARV
jgi:hypothetical protein